MSRQKAVFIGVIIAVVFIAVAGIVGRIESHYSRTGTVTEIENEMIVVEDTTGNLWAVEAADFAIGDTVSMEMFTRGTSEIEDDIVEKVRLENE